MENKKISDICNPEETESPQATAYAAPGDDHVGMEQDDQEDINLPELDVEDLSTYRPWLYTQHTHGRQQFGNQQPAGIADGTVLEFDEATDVPSMANHQMVGGDFRAHNHLIKNAQCPAPIYSDSSTCFTPNIQNMRRSGVKGFDLEASSQMKSNEQKNTQFESLFAFHVLEDEGRTTEFVSAASEMQRQTAREQSTNSVQSHSSMSMEILDQEASTSVAPNFQPESAFTEIFDQKSSKDRNDVNEADMIDFLQNQNSDSNFQSYQDQQFQFGRPAEPHLASLLQTKNLNRQHPHATPRNSLISSSSEMSEQSREQPQFDILQEVSPMQQYQVQQNALATQASRALRSIYDQNSASQQQQKVMFSQGLSQMLSQRFGGQMGAVGHGGVIGEPADYAEKENIGGPGHINGAQGYHASQFSACHSGQNRAMYPQATTATAHQGIYMSQKLSQTQNQQFSQVAAAAGYAGAPSHAMNVSGNNTINSQFPGPQKPLYFQRAFMTCDEKAEEGFHILSTQKQQIQREDQEMI